MYALIKFIYCCKLNKLHTVYLLSIYPGFLSLWPHVLMGFVRASPCTQFALLTSGLLKCQATCVQISLTAGYYRLALINLWVPPNGLTCSPGQYFWDIYYCITLSIKTLCWKCLCQTWNTCNFTSPAGEVVAYWQLKEAAFHLCILISNSIGTVTSEPAHSLINQKYSQCNGMNANIQHDELEKRATSILGRQHKLGFIQSWCEDL